MEIVKQYLKKMKPNNLWYTGVILLLLLASCNKNDNPENFNAAKLTVFNYIGSNKNLSLYQTALKRAGMYNTETFSNGGPFTVFAPVDSAFTKAGLTLDSINKYDPQALALVLKYAIVYGKISSSSLLGFYAQNVNCLNPANKPNLTKNYYGIFLDGIPLEAGGSTDLNDGVMQLVTRVPAPPIDNVFSIISKTKDLTLLTAAIKRAGYETRYSGPSPSNGGNFTLFAATDEAFKNFGYPDVPSVQNADPGVLQTLLRTVTMQGIRQYTSGFRGGYSINYKYLYVKVDGFTLISTGNTLPTHIIRPDILATNGIIHVVDQVIATVN